MSRNQHAGRTDLAKAAGKRLDDARKLQVQRRWLGAMYLAGYCIECRLKARLMERYRVWTLPELEEEIERRSGRRINAFTHRIEVLFELTDARKRLGKHGAKDVRLAYEQCNRWLPAWRYDPAVGDEEGCASFLDAVEIFDIYIQNNT